MLPGRSLVGAALVSAGLVGLLAALVPFVPGVARLAEQPTGPAHYGYVAIGLPLVIAGAMLLSSARRRLTRGPVLVAVAVAVAVPVLVLLAVLAAWGGALLTPGVRAPEIARLLLVGAPAAALVSPLVLTVALAAPMPVRLALGRRKEAWLLGGVLLAFATIVGLAVAQQPSFTWDESVYALIARHWVAGTPSTGWGPHRPVVLSAIGLIPAALGEQEWSFRLITLLFGLGCVAAAWFLGRTLSGPIAGLLAAAAVAASPNIAADAGLFLNDVPSTGALLLLTALAWRALQRPRPELRAVLWLAPVAALAFYLRYGSIISIGALGLVALAIWPQRLLAAWRTLLAAIGLLLLLLLPHAILATAQTGSPLGIALAAQGGASPDYVGEALLEYLDWLPAPLAGVVPGALIVIGLAGGAARLLRAARRRAWDAESRAAALLIGPALLQIVVLGLFILPQDRYVFYPVALLTVAGAMVLVQGALDRGRIGRAVVGMATAAVALGLAVNAVGVPAAAARRVPDFGWERDLGRLLGRVGGESCSVLAADVPQIVWYSGCEAYTFGDLRAAPDRDQLLTGTNRFLVVRSDGHFQPDAGAMQAYLSRADPDPVGSVTSADGALTATVYRFR